LIAARVAVRVQPGARAAGFAGRAADGAWKLKVRAPAREGEANEAVCELLAERLGVPRGRVRIARGLTARAKTIEVDGLTQQEVDARLARIEEKQ
jgi:uncharacterized protein